MLAPEIDEKSMSFARSDFLKKCGFSTARIKKLRVQGFEVGGKNRSKIDEKMKSRWEGILASIFHGFSSILEAKLAPSWGRKSIKNQSKKALKKRCEKEGEKIGKGRHLGVSWAI